MKGHKLTPAQAQTVVRVYLKTANASAAARHAGCSPQTAARYIVRAGLDKAGELYARALARGEREALATLRRARRKVSVALDTANTARDIADLTRAAVASAQCAANAKMVHAKISGAMVEKHHVEHSGNLVIHMPAESPPAESGKP